MRNFARAFGTKITVKKSGGFMRSGRMRSRALRHTNLRGQWPNPVKAGYHATLSAVNAAPGRNRRASRTAVRETVLSWERSAIVLATLAVR